VETNQAVMALLHRLRELRERRKLTAETLEERLVMGPGWIECFERGEAVPGLDVLAVILDALDESFESLAQKTKVPRARGQTKTAIDRFISAAEHRKTKRGRPCLTIEFRYASHDAQFVLPSAKLSEFEQVVRTMRDGLAKLIQPGADETQIKTNAVADTFLKAVKLWPHANPSDLWWFVVGRIFHDPFNHPASYARLDLGQSWRRTGGWALEKVLVTCYGPALRQHGIRMFIARGEEKARFISELKTNSRLEPDKVDVLLVGTRKKREICFGVVHVKSSFAERRTDDVPMSKALVDAGYCSPLWTMDSKSQPSDHPVNRGELGPVKVKGADSRSAKRRDIEDDGYFSACFSYNKNTVPTPARERVKARITTCDLNRPADDPFSKFILKQWKAFRAS